MPAPTAPAHSSTQLSPGSRFSIPPFTDEVEQPENNDGLVSTFNATAQQTVQGIIPFMQSDVIYEWLLFAQIQETITQGAGGAITQSPYYPEMYFGPFQLNMQYQYPAIDVASLFDLGLITKFRPFDMNSNNYPLNSAQTVSAGLYSSQANQVTSQTAYSPTSGTPETRNMVIEIPACCWFDEYYELDETGQPLSGPHNGYVSPQNMGGYARVVTPSLKLNGLMNGGADNSPYQVTGTGPTASGTATLGFSRIGVLGNVDSSVLPQPTNWQYNIAHLRWSLSGVSKTSIPLNSIFAGQIMSIVVRLYDPTAGAPITLSSNLSSATNSIQLIYGGNVNRWVGNQQRMQWRFFNQHGYRPQEGVVILDLAMDRTGKICNSYCLNTLRTAAVNLNLLFSGALSNTAYAEITIEGLRYVPLPVRPNQ